MHKVKDEYIEYLQRQLDENNKNVIRLESKLNELQKRFKNLIDDNRVLNDTLNEKGTKLNELMQENENLRLQINNYIDNETKYKLQLQYYEKQIGLYENNINDYNNIINDLKVSNEKLTNDLSQNLDNKKNESNSNNYSTNNSNNYNNNYNYFNVRNITNNNGELQLIKNQNMIYVNDIKSKDYTIDLMTKKNNKLMSENKIYKSQIQQYAQQITNLYNILKQKNKIISIYRQKEGFTDNSLDIEFEKKLEELNLNFLNNNEMLLDMDKEDVINTNYKYENNNPNGDRLTQLFNDNEKNKKKIDIINNKIKSLNQIDNKNNKNDNNVNKINKPRPKHNRNNKSPFKRDREEANLQYGNSWKSLISPTKPKENREEKINNYMVKKFIKRETR